ncbi:carbohydrate kinase [Terrabacter sp. Soil811]|uniref:NAD(P)H-hydrate dehydratase n=1 Tax=Terrabacter sp. Soil811 TaxID=1736419 RepID=UPI0007017DE7|nr:NAD(P)H-hydrate dehydratase [Terrabacter sp. Soil811]KRF41984.1 carbohydrate kinase [Terrabacter sp. Soil811]
MPDEHPAQVDEALLRGWRLPDPGGDKSDRGTVLVVGGARQTPGAVLLAAEAALRVGAGKVQVATAADTAATLAVALPEAFVEGLPVLHDGELAIAGADRVLELASAADVVLLGPGLGQPQSANLFAAQIVPHLGTRLVLDALGTAYLTGRLDGVRHLAGRALLTPNVSELAALLDRPEEDVSDDQLGAVRAVADATEAVVLGGGEVSYVVRPGGESWSCDSGPTGLATAGSGDAKAGAAAGLLARGATPEQAAVWAAWLHARAGEALQDAQPGFLARDVVRSVPRMLHRFEAC